MIYKFLRLYYRWSLARDYCFRQETEKLFRLELARIDAATKETENKIAELEGLISRREIKRMVSEQI